VDEATRAAVYAALAEVARAGGTIGYRALAGRAGLDLDQPADRAALAAALRAISTAEHAAGRPLLSAVVVLQGRGRPGRGFFALARALGRHTDPDDAAFFRRELACVHATWAARAQGS
jgi:hypothetical protein